MGSICGRDGRLIISSARERAYAPYMAYRVEPVDYHRRPTVRNSCRRQRRTLLVHIRFFVFLSSSRGNLRPPRSQARKSKSTHNRETPERVRFLNAHAITYGTTSVETVEIALSFWRGRELWYCETARGGDQLAARVLFTKTKIYLQRLKLFFSGYSYHCIYRCGSPTYSC